MRNRVAQPDAVSRWLLRWLAVLAAIAMAGPARATPRVALGPIRGRSTPELIGEVYAELCAAFECVPWSRVSKADAPDPAKARRLGVAGILVGRVGRQRGEPVLSLSLYTRRTWAPVTWRVAVDRQGTLDRRGMALVVTELETRLGGGTSRRAAPPPPPPVVAVERAPARVERRAEPVARAPDPVRLAPDPAAREAPQPEPLHVAHAEIPLPPPPVAVRVSNPPTPTQPAPVRPPPVARQDANRAAWLTVEAGAFAARRALRFADAGGASVSLREHTARVYAGPEVRLSVFPAAPFTRGGAAGAGLFVRYGASLNLKTRTDAGEQLPTNITRLELGATWRITPFSGWRLMVAPAISWMSLRVQVAPPVPGLPDANLSGFRGGLDLELPLGESFALLLGGGYARWLGAQDLIGGSRAFFPGGSAWAVDAEGGISVAIAGPVSTRLVGEYRSTRYQLDPDPTGVYRASTASDTHLGGRLTLSVRF
jgi:hypothetical protein